MALRVITPKRTFIIAIVYGHQKLPPKYAFGKIIIKCFQRGRKMNVKVMTSILTVMDQHVHSRLSANDFYFSNYSQSIL